jgi:hypothetical protein
VVQLEAILRGHRRSTSSRIQDACQGIVAVRGRERSGRSWTGGGTVGGGKDATPGIYHPVGDLAHAQSCDMAELFLLLFAWVGVIRMAVEPCLEVVSSLFGKLSSFALGTVGEGRARNGRWGTGW